MLRLPLGCQENASFLRPHYQGLANAGRKSLSGSDTGCVRLESKNLKIKIKK